MSARSNTTHHFKTEVKGMKFITGEFDEVMQFCEHNYADGFFCFTYSCNRNEQEIARFIDESLRLTRFCNEYKGRVVVDLSECFQKGFFDEPAYAFLYFIKDRMKVNRVEFMSTESSDKLVDELEKFYKTEIKRVSLNKSTKDNRVKIGFAVADAKEDENVRV